jgi:hypothetical protein
MQLLVTLLLAMVFLRCPAPVPFRALQLGLMILLLVVTVWEIVLLLVPLLRLLRLALLVVVRRRQHLHSPGLRGLWLRRLVRVPRRRSSAQG